MQQVISHNMFWCLQGSSAHWRFELFYWGSNSSHSFNPQPVTCVDFYCPTCSSVGKTIIVSMAFVQQALHIQKQITASNLLHWIADVFSGATFREAQELGMLCWKRRCGKLKSIQTITIIIQLSINHLHCFKINASNDKGVFTLLGIPIVFIGFTRFPSIS